MDGDLSFLVVDDDEGIRRALRRALSAYGTVEAVGTCAAARLALRTRGYDAAVFDVHLPDGLGVDLIDQARERNAAICILVLTGSSEHSVISRVHEKKASYLLKPFDASQLKVLVEEARDRRNAYDRRLDTTLKSWIDDCDLSRVEVALLALGAKGYPRDSFARHRGVRPDTVRKQIQSLLRKTGHDTFELAVNALLREALTDPK
jgi:DNA-binding NarL/FixJ family response regulator